jgi:hypothetical protein
MSFGGSRDLYAVFGYPNTLSSEQLYAKYERQDITSRIVDKPAEDTWTRPPKIKDASSEFETAWTALTAKFDIWPVLTQIDKLCWFGPFSCMWVGIPGATDRPAPRTVTVDDIQYLQAFGGSNAKVERLESANNPRFGMPMMYTFNVVGGQGLSQRVHWSRVVHIVDRPLQGSVVSVPKLAQVYNILDDLLKTAGGSSETFWLTSNRGLQADIDKEMDLDPEDEAALSAELDEYQHQLRRVIRTRGVKVTNLGSDVADPRGTFTVLMSLLASTTGIPQRILMGAEAGQLASEQDRANWADYITVRREAFAEPYVLRPFIRRMTEMGVFPPQEKPVMFDWPDAFQLSPLEKAQTMAQTARAAVNLSRLPMEGFPILTQEECRVILHHPAEVPAGQTLPEPLPDTPPQADPDDPNAPDPDDPDEDEVPDERRTPQRDAPDRNVAALLHRRRSR